MSNSSKTYPLSCIDFGNEAGDDISSEELLPMFVEQQITRKFLSDKNKFLLATAKKGVGKSALIKWLEAKIPCQHDAEKSIVISLKGSDLVRSSFGLTEKLTNPNDNIRDWMVRICTIINRNIGAHLKFALDDDAISLVESSEIDGFKSRNIMSALCERFIKLLPKRLDHKKLPISNEIELLKRMSKYPVWVLVDDLDATYQRTESENLELSTFFSACRRIAADMKGICIRATMRTDVWAMIRRYDESLDKVSQYVTDITWNESDFRELLYKRIYNQLCDNNYTFHSPSYSVSEEEKQEYVINTIFENKFEWGDGERMPYKILYTLSYHRPRWAIQLCKLAQEKALNDNRKTINKQDLYAIWGGYGLNRISDIVAEHRHQCSRIEELVSGFRGAERKMTRENLLQWIKNRITNHLTVDIEGKSVRDPLKIANFLYRIGFIVARTDSEYYEHYDFSQMPDFLESKTNNDFGVVWEIHPCYREALDIQKLNKFQRDQRNWKNK